MNQRALAMLLSVALVGLVAGACSGPTLTVVDITLTETPYTFQPDGYDFKIGTTYALTFNVPKEFHTFTLNDLGVDISINAGESVVAEFTPTHAGTFKLICVPHFALGMEGEVRIS